MYLKANSKLVLPSNSKYRLAFEYNHADEDGAAMYIDDDTYHATCCVSNNLYQCFLQISPVSKHAIIYRTISQDNQIIASNLSNNATLRTTIFGGDFCTNALF